MAHRSRSLELLVFTVGAGSLGAEIAAARLLAPWFGASTIVWANTIAVVLVALFTPRGRLERKEGGVDVLGGVLFVLGALGTLLALSEGSTWGWSSGKTLVWGIGGVVFLALWAGWELMAKNPLINVRFFARPAFFWPACAVFFYGAAIGALFLLSYNL